MRTLDVSEITENIKEMCIEANHFLSEDMKCAMQAARGQEASALGRQILGQLEENMGLSRLYRQQAPARPHHAGL